MNKEKIANHIIKNSHEDVKAISLLLQVNLEVQAITLIYAAIDRMAWLDSDEEESGGEEFMTWVETFLFNGETFDFNSRDLWAARCGTIHTGAAESRDYRKSKANVIYYHVNTSPVTNEQLLALIEPISHHIGVPCSDIRLVDHIWLARRLADAVTRFSAYLRSANDDKLRRVLVKANRQLSFQAL